MNAPLGGAYVQAQTTYATTLASLALLQVNYDFKKSDYLDYFLPFVTHVLRSMRNEKVTREAVQKLLQSEFGLRIPQHPVELVLRRLARKKVLEKIHGTYFVGELPDDDFETRREDTAYGLKRLCHAIQSFVSAAHQVDWTVEDAEKGLLEYVGANSLVFLRQHIHGSVVPLVKSDKRSAFLISKFIEWACKSDPDWLDVFDSLVKGNVLANGLLCPDLGNIERKFADVAFYLDTPLLIQLLGLEGEDRQAPLRELVGSLYKLKATIAVFESTLNELSRVIEANVKNFDNPRFNSSIVDALRKKGQGASELVLQNGRLHESLATYQVVARTDPDYSKKNHGGQVDETKLTECLATNIQYRTTSAVEHDVRAIRNIYILRERTKPQNVEDARAIFVTSNSALAREALEFDSAHESDAIVGPVMTDFSLATLAFLKSPIEANHIPRLRLIADCYAALSPSQEMWDKFNAQLERLVKRGNISPDDHLLLRTSPQTKSEMMNLTMGSSEAFDNEGILAILARVKGDIQQEVREEERQKQLRVEAEASREKAALKAEYARKLSDKELEAQRQRSEATKKEKQLEEQQEWGNAQVTRSEAFAISVGQAVATLINILAITLVVGGIIVAGLGIFSPGGIIVPWYLRYPGYALSLIGAVAWPLFSAMTGKGVTFLGRTAGDFVTRRIKARLLEDDHPNSKST